MRGGHAIYGLCLYRDGKTALPNAAYVSLQEAEMAVLEAKEDDPDETWVIRFIWLQLEQC